MMKTLYSKFAKHCLDRINCKDVVVNDEDDWHEGLKRSHANIFISPYVFIKSPNILSALDFADYDIIVEYEMPILDVMNRFKTEGVKSYSTNLIGFNNEKLKKAYIDGKMTDVELYDYCHEHGYRVKALFTNIMVNEKMKMFGYQYIPEDIRKKHVNDIIRYFEKHGN